MGPPETEKLLYSKRHSQQDKTRSLQNEKYLHQLNYFLYRLDIIIYIPILNDFAFYRLPLAILALEYELTCRMNSAVNYSFPFLYASQYETVFSHFSPGPM